MGDKKWIGFLVFKVIFNITGVALILFLSAGTIQYQTGWVFVILLVVIATLYSVFMIIKQPDLFKKRLCYKESNHLQLSVIMLSLFVCVIILFVSGLSVRNSWLCLPNFRYYISAILFLCATVMYLNVIKENSFLTSEITIQPNQKVVTTGLYKILRHPMYTSMVIYMWSAVLFLGSVLAMGISMLFIPILILRIINEEKILKANLPGYVEYTKKVKYRLVPFLW